MINDTIGYTHDMIGYMNDSIGFQKKVRDLIIQTTIPEPKLQKRYN
jgi:hypothetical protein